MFADNPLGQGSEQTPMAIGFERDRRPIERCLAHVTLEGNLLQRAQGNARSAPGYRCVAVAAADRLPAGSTARTAVTNPPWKAVPDTPYVAVNSPPGHAWSRS